MAQCIRLPSQKYLWFQYFIRYRTLFDGSAAHRTQQIGAAGDVRVIYYNQLGESSIWLLTIYAKSRQENAPSYILRALKEELVDGHE